MSLPDVSWPASCQTHARVSSCARVHVRLVNTRIWNHTCCLVAVGMRERVLPLPCGCWHARTRPPSVERLYSICVYANMHIRSIISHTH